MSETENAKIKQIGYEAYVVFYTSNNEAHDDFESNFLNNLYVCRFPMLKSASFSVFTITLPVHLFILLNEELLTSRFPKVKIKLTMLDMSKADNDTVYNYEKLETTKELFYTVLQMQPKEKLTSKTVNMSTTFTIVSSIMNELNYGNRFNVIYEKKSGYELIEEYKNFLNLRYPNSNLVYKEYVKSEFISNYKYEQILIKVDCDLNVLDQIIRHYKPFLNFCYYFFDDFDITSEGMINLNIVDLMDLSNFTEWDPTEEGFHDVFTNLNFQKQVQISDKSRSIKRHMNNASLVFINKHKNFNLNKQTNNSVIHDFTNEESQTQINSVRTIQSNTLQNTTYKSTPTNHFTSLYISDNLENTITRYQNSEYFIHTKAESVFTYTLTNSHLDAIRFNYKYKFDLYDNKSFFVPINIVNIFERYNTTEAVLIHKIKFQCIKYKKDQEVQN